MVEVDHLKDAVEELEQLGFVATSSAAAVGRRRHIAVAEHLGVLGAAPRLVARTQVVLERDEVAPLYIDAQVGLDVVGQDRRPLVEVQVAALVHVVFAELGHELGALALQVELEAGEQLLALVLELGAIERRRLELMRSHARLVGAHHQHGGAVAAVAVVGAAEDRVAVRVVLRVAVGARLVAAHNGVEVVLLAEALAHVLAEEPRDAARLVAYAALLGAERRLGRHRIAPEQVDELFGHAAPLGLVALLERDRGEREAVELLALHVVQVDASRQAAVHHEEPIAHVVLHYGCQRQRLEQLLGFVEERQTVLVELQLSVLCF